MFLGAVLARNPKLIETAVALHREAAIPPNTYVIDLDAVESNASLLSNAARKNGLSLYFTTKQIGFNPLVARCVSQAGIPKALAIDFREASVLSQNHVPIGNVGHIVQVPAGMISPVLALSPEVITVFGLEKAGQISQAARRLGVEARLLLRVTSPQDFFYPGQEGGIPLENLIDTATAIQRLPNVRIAGVTSFPCLQFDEDSCSLSPSSNFNTILQAARLLKQRLGLRLEQINAPGNTCVSSLSLLSQMGATHGEPGHALTGTTYLHTRLGEPEQPALVYVSEVSHVDGDKVRIFGGGTYRRAKISRALVGASLATMQKAEVSPLDPSVIDYYLTLSLPGRRAVRVGDSVVMAFRTQIFTTRASVAVVRGIQQGTPAFLGLFDAWGGKLESIF